MPTRPPKKNDTIEVRLPDDVKAAFMARCRREGRTASEAIRLFIADHLAPSSKPRQPRMPYWRTAAAALAGVALGVGAAPSFAWTGPNGRPSFDQLDRNHDGVLTRQEYHAR